MNLKDSDNFCFVFGSNKSGIHGAGAALYAKRYYGAKEGVGEGISGNSYALPTKGFSIEDLPLEEIKKSVKKFKYCAAYSAIVNFKVTCVGTGLARWKHSDIAPLFIGSPSNCYFDLLWEPWLGSSVEYWGTY